MHDLHVCPFLSHDVQCDTSSLHGVQYCPLMKYPSTHSSHPRCVFSMQVSPSSVNGRQVLFEVRMKKSSLHVVHETLSLHSLQLSMHGEHCLLSSRKYPSSHIAHTLFTPGMNRLQCSVLLSLLEMQLCETSELLSGHERHVDSSMHAVQLFLHCSHRDCDSS